MEINLSPFKYRNIFSTDGGPILRLNVFHPDIKQKNDYEAVAFLLPSLVPKWHKKSSIYNNGHGNGTHRLRNVACYIAISEALERWAYFNVCVGKEAVKFGFDIEPNTTGMAAFPGVTKTSARIRANWEAVERWSIVEWWNNLLQCELLSGSNRRSGALCITSPFKNFYTVITWATILSGEVAYGFASADNPKKSIRKACIEQNRNILALNRLKKDVPLPLKKIIIDKKQPLFDRRLIFFASKEGFDMFWEKVVSSVKMPVDMKLPDKLVDGEIIGPWSKYATVWRILYKHALYEHVNELRYDFFMF
ncbi:MAG: hypothetical protein KA059_02785 [Elusimicrobiales bacterium]|nr:hypothetical protein [Elusimicrobiales bacterium]